MERTDISILPEVLLEKIMLRVPLESLVDQCIRVCRKWRSTIRDEKFERLYWAQSMTRPRLLIEYSRGRYPQPSDKLFQSVYQQEEPLLSSGLKQMLISSAPVDYYMFSAPQRGLVCLGYETKFVLCNPATNKVKALPECERLRPVGESEIICFFGYDEVTKVFTFLISEIDGLFISKYYLHKPLMRHQVFTVKLDELKNIKEKHWRVIECDQHNHVPVTKSLCLKGVLYYGAKSPLMEMDKSMIISFDMRSEKFTIIDMPEGVELAYVGDRLVNYNGEVCLVKDCGNVMVDGTREYQIYVKDENAIGKWRKVTVVIPRLGDADGDVSCVGTIGTTFVFATESVRNEGSPLVLYYDTASRTVRLFNIGGVGNLYYAPQTFMNHYDSLLLM